MHATPALVRLKWGHTRPQEGSAEHHTSSLHLTDRISTETHWNTENKKQQDTTPAHTPSKDRVSPPSTVVGIRSLELLLPYSICLRTRDNDRESDDEAETDPGTRRHTWPQCASQGIFWDSQAVASVEILTVGNCSHHQRPSTRIGGVSCHPFGF
jgi:hypothetical protein